MGRLRKKIGLGLALFIAPVVLAALAVLADVQGGLASPAGGPTGKSLAWMAWGGFALLAAGAGAGFFFWLNRSVLMPLERAAAAARKIARGRLDDSLPEGSPGEIGELGRSVNEMSANVQEALLHVWRGTGQCRRLLEAARRDLGGGPEPKTADALSRIEQGCRTLDAMRSFVGAFDFYEIRLDPDRDRIVSAPKVRDVKN